eukprot:gene3929-14005_t
MPGVLLKAIDFGLAIQHMPDEPKLTVISGTPAYMAPELIAQKYDEKCDIWSVGMVTYQLLTGRFPYWEDVRMYNLQDVWKSIQTEEIDWEAAELSPLSDDAVDFLKALLTREPEHRPSAAIALKHPWVKEEGSAEDAPLTNTVVQAISCCRPQAPMGQGGGISEDAPLTNSVVQRLQRFSTYGRLKQRVLQMIFNDMKKEREAAANGSGSFDVMGGQREAFIQSVQDLFKDIDTDASGGITIEELCDMDLQDLTHDVKQLGNNIDFDRSGDIDLQELMITLIDWSQLQQENSWKYYLDKAFDKIDANGNGFIELEELVAQLEEASGAKRMLREADINADGEISREEFHTLLQESWAQDALNLAGADFLNGAEATQGSSSTGAAFLKVARLQTPPFSFLCGQQQRQNAEAKAKAKAVASTKATKATRLQTPLQISGRVWPTTLKVGMASVVVGAT